VVGVIARILVGAAFVVAGVAKLAAGRNWPDQAAGLGVGRMIAVPLPWAEVALGASTMVGLVHPWPAWACTVMLAAFTVVIAAHLRRGARPPCACFGTWSARPIEPGHLVRNGVLFGLAVVGALA
jgi:uncharacterized membrane protein YphA (DoxX/SURF4 family)